MVDFDNVGGKRKDWGVVWSISVNDVSLVFSYPGVKFLACLPKINTIVGFT
mgnify:CR=1 FL=1